MSVSRVRRNYPILGFSWKAIATALVFALLLSLFLASIAKLKNTEYFPVRNVKLFGGPHLDHQEVQALISPMVDKGFFAVDVDRIKEQLLQMPWVDQVMVRRTWPDQVIVTIIEKNPFALWNNKSLLSSTGELFSPTIKTYPPGLPQLVGPAGEQIYMAQYYTKLNKLLTPLHAKISRLELTPALAWRLTLDNGIKLNIGHKDVLTRIRHFVKVYPEIVGNRVNEVEYIDLRYPNVMAVRFKSVT